MAQYGRPSSDISTGTWTTTPLWGYLDDNVDTDFVTSAKNPTNDTFEVLLSSVTDPSVHTGHVGRVRLRDDKNAGTANIYLYQGGTLISSNTGISLTSSWTTYTITISEAQAGNITDYSNLRIRVDANGTANNYGYCAWAELEVPDAGTPASDNASAYLHGKADDLDNQLAYLAGGLDTSSNTSAFIYGGLGASSSMSAYIEGDATGQVIGTYDFEEGDTTDLQSVTGGAAVTAAAGIVGNYGLEITVAADTGDDWGSLVNFSPTHNTDRIRIRWVMDISNMTMGDNDYMTIMVTRDESTFIWIIQMELRYDTGTGYQLRARAKTDEDSFVNGNYVVVDETQPICVEMYVVRESTNGADDGTVDWWLNGIEQTAAAVTGVGNFASFSDITHPVIGNRSAHVATTSGTMYFDDIIVRDDDTEIGLPPMPVSSSTSAFICGCLGLVDEIDHETGDNSEYSNTSNGADLLVNGTAALHGSYGLAVVVSSGDTSYDYYEGVYTTISGQYVGVRIYIDPNNYNMALNQFQNVIMVRSTAAFTTIGGISLYYDGTNIEAACYIYTDGGSLNLSSRIDIPSSGATCIEALWTRASSDVAADATLDWWIDGSAQTSVIGIDNYDSIGAYTYLRIGNSNRSSSSENGTYYLDDIVVRDDGQYIGLISSGTDTSDNQSAYLAGSVDDNDNQSAFAQGSIDTTDNQTVYLSGGIETSDNQSVYTVGSEETQDNQAAYLAGSLDDQDNIPAYLEGIASAIDNKAAYLVSSDRSLDNQASYLAGSQDASDNQSAYLACSLSVIDNVPAYLVSEDTALDNVPAYLDAKNAAQDNSSAYLVGQDSDLDNIPAYLNAEDTDSDSRSAYLVAEDTDSSNASAYLIGYADATDSTEVYLAGGIETQDNIPAYVFASAISANDSNSAYLSGVDTDSSSVSAFIHGYLDDQDNSPAYLVGQESTADNQSAFLQGSQDDSSSVSAYLVGLDTETSSISAYLTGIDTDVDNQPAYTHGYDTDSSSVSAYLSGGIETVNNFNAYASGKALTVNSLPVYIHGYDITVSSSPVYLHGVDTDSSSVPAFLLGSDNIADSILSYLKGKIDTDSFTPAYTDGQDTSLSSTPAYLVGGIVSSDNTPAYMMAIGEWLIPDGDITVNTWKREDEGTSNLYASIDETQPNDSDYVYHADVSGTEYFEVSLSDPSSGIVGDGDVTIYWRGEKIGSDTVTMRVQLYEGTTLIATNDEVFSGSFATFTYTLSSGEKASITDWTNLRLRFIVQGVV